MTSPTTRPADSDDEHAAAQRRAAVRAEVTRARDRRRRWRRIRRRGKWVVLGVLVVVGAIAAWAGLTSRDDLLAARTAMEQGRSALLNGDVNRALTAFGDADARFWATEQRLGSPFVRPLELIPVLGANLRAPRMLAASGRLLAEAGDELAAATLDLPEGTATLAPRNGAIPLAPLGQVALALQRASELGAEAEAVAAAAPQRFLVDQVSLARAEVVAQTEQVNGMLSAAADLTAALPPFLGAFGPRRYFFGAQNPAELRGTGGFIGAYAVLTADRGRLEFTPFRSVIDITTTVIPDVPAPSEEFAARYEQYGGAGFPQNVNMTPDFPTAAEAILNLYEAAKGERLDGVIVADPFMLQSLVAATAPVDVPGAGLVGAEDIVDVMAVEGYGYVPDSHDRKQVYGDVAAGVLQRFLSQGGEQDAVRGARALVEAASQGHLLLHSAEPAEQERFADLGVDGAVPTGEGDLLGVVVNNGGANKLDHFTDRAVSAEAWLQPDGSALTALTVELSSDAPTQGWPVDVIGPNIDVLEAGENRVLLSIYAAAGASLERVNAGDGLEDVTVSQELGRPVFDSWEQLSSGDTRTRTYILRTPDVWDPASDTGRYLLQWHNQPTSRPTSVQITVHLPDGAQVLERSAGVQGVGETAVWAGRGDRLGEIDLAFRPRPAGAWDRAWRFLRQPLW